MATPVTMPMLGLTMEEGTVAEWLKQEGQAVRKDEPLFVVEMDKGTQEVLAPASGVLRKILVGAGQTVAVKTLLAEIGAADEAALDADAGPGAASEAARAAGAGSGAPGEEAGELSAGPDGERLEGLGGADASAASESTAALGVDAGDEAASAEVSEGVGAPAVAPDTGGVPTRRQVEAAAVEPVGGAARVVSHIHPPRAGTSATAGASGERVFASPRARLRARELGVAVEQVRGSGPRGRVVEEDVLRFAESEAARAAGLERLRVVASPLARRLALEHGVDIGQVRGSGSGGRVTQEDVLSAAEAARGGQAPSRAEAGRGAQAPGSGEPGAEAGRGAPGLVRPDGEAGRVASTPMGSELKEAGRAASAPARPEADRGAPAPEGPGPGTGDGVEALSRVRRITAERMALSARSVARVTLFLEADLTETARFRQQLAPELARLGVAKLPWDALLAKAAGLALAEHPVVNVTWVEGQGIRRNQGVHVGVAVALEPEGLVVPVLRDADSRSPRELAADLLALVERARQNRLGPMEMQGGTFTITNLGGYRVQAFTPIINPPETAILGVGTIAEQPAVRDGQLTVRTLSTLSLSFDHRAVDGAPAAAFLQRLAELLERPFALLGI